MLGAGPDRAEELTRLRDALGYPGGYDSPKSFDPTATPAATDRRAIVGSDPCDRRTPAEERGPRGSARGRGLQQE